MLSVNYLSNYLDVKQDVIDNYYYSLINNFEKNKNIVIKQNEEKQNISINKFNINLTQSFDILFNKSIIDFYYDNKIYKNTSEVFTFINSIFNIINETFNLYDLNEKERIVKDFIKMIDQDLFQKDLYNKFNYTKNRTFNKLDIQKTLNDAFNFQKSNKFNLLIEYISDYLGINIYIIELNNNIIDILNSKYYLTKYYNNINKYVPNLIIIYNNGIYKPILKHNRESSLNTSLLTYSENSNIIDNLWNLLNINIESSKNIQEINQSLIKLYKYIL
jgi:hypothetical protein